MEIQVAEAPFSLSATIKSNIAPILLAILAIVGAVFAISRMGLGKGEDTPKHEAPMDFEAAFDEPIESPSDPEERFRPPVGGPEQSLEDPIIDGLAELLSVHSEASKVDIPPAPELGQPAPAEDPVKPLLDKEDIEALFDD